MDRAAHPTAGQGRGGSPRRSGSGTHSLPGSAFEEPDVQGVIVHDADKGYVGAMREARVPAALRGLVTTVVGPGNNATFKKPAQIRKVSAGDVIVVPAGVYHGFSEVPDHIEYVLVRPDVEKVLPAGYVNPALKKQK